MSTDIVPRATLEALCANRETALERYREGVTILLDALRLHSAAAPGEPYISGIPDGFHRDLRYANEEGREATVADFADEMRRRVDRDMWKSIVSSTALWSLLDEEEHKRFSASLEKDPPPVTPDNVLATIQRLSDESGTIFRRGLVNAFRSLSRDYKSNDGFKVGERCVVEYAVERYSGSRFWPNHRKTDQLRDVDRVMHVLDGKPAPGYQEGLFAAMRTAMQDGLPEAVTPYWRVKWFKNGNAHLWALRMDLVDKANLLIAEHYGKTLGNDQARGSKFNGPVKHADDLGHYPSPDLVVHRILHAAEIEPDMVVLEPSAGCGNISDRIARAGVRVRVVELDHERATALEKSGQYVSVFCADFLHVHFEELFDRVVMNPPFANGAAIRHVHHALSFLKPGGRLVAVMPANTLHREDALAKEFVGVLRTMQYRHEVLPDDSFEESGTSVRTLLLIVDKPLDVTR